MPDCPRVRATALAAAAFAALAATPSWAAERGDVLVKVGAAAIRFDSSAQVSVAGSPVPGGDAHLSDGTTATMELEYYVTRSVSLAADFGLPLDTRIEGRGSLAPLGTGGKARYGIGGATVRLHPFSGAVSPFVGGGVGHLFIFDTTDGAIGNLKVKDAWAPVVQGGVDVALGHRFGLYASVAYAPMKTDASGTVLGAPMTARVTLNPTVLIGGVSYRF